MATPPPNPSEGEEGVSVPELAEESSGERPTSAQKMFIAPPASQLPTKLQFVARGAPGPSGGIKQCFRTVKTARRVPTLPRRDEEPLPGPSAEPQRPARRDRHKRHACSTCDKRFSSPGKLQQHVLSHTGELPFSCDLCDKKFNSKFKLVRHNLIHSEARAFKCGTCGKTFNRKDHLTNHERVHNPTKKLYTCERPDCRKSYTSSLSFRKHAALHSAEEGNLQCKICDEVFATRQEIFYHLKVHTGSRTVKNETDKKFTCDHCDRRFFTAKDVRRHLVVHTGRRDFLCPHCPQKFGRKDHLVRHMKNGHPEESVKSATPGTSSEPPPESTSFEETYSEFQLEGADFVWKASSPKEHTSEIQTRVPSTEIIVEIPPELDIKVEPSEAEIEESLDTHVKVEQPTSPSCELLSTGPYPVMFMVSAPYTHTASEAIYVTSEELPNPIRRSSEAILLDPLLMDPGEGPSGLSNEMLGLLEESEPSYPVEESLPAAPPQPQRLPAFRKAFQTAKSPKPPPPPPPL
ncbi:zinc finger protein PLAGL1-like [Plodia interpunctella]|uniref:zinc finger protein PLAGL1-like n=1 Tax=Plodia interpunctella TaxID=58824 RepID=UPI002368BB13|nr:zinc finger protein PLAGL1-like [Plodia interpunctella]